MRVTSFGGGELYNIIGSQRYDVYQTNGNAWQINTSKNIRMATLELSEFGLNATNIGSVSLMRLTMNNSADTAFLAYNEDSFGEFCTDLDTDGDGVVDRLDLDSDNDGIYDVVEAGHTLTYTNGRLTGSVGSDGIDDTLQGNPNNQTTNYIITDTNSDGTPDFQNLDSDGDGCEDVSEAGFTDENIDGYLGDNPIVVDSNGLVTSGTDGYTEPADVDTSGEYDFKEQGIAPSITTEPSNRNICPGCTGTFSTITADADTFQWQYYSGTNWIDLMEGGLYSGTDSQTLNISNPTAAEDGNQYRLLVSNSTYSCILLTSNVVTLNVRVNTIITNRRITYRVNRN
ncbi:hypothetical protein [Maribacter sp. 4G9]|uniref:hypothetical protein n=1 Tax=Maribacter sp. 4G9 TaxID=1889777 RepID=UPI000C14E1FB|nr:hypothetical protein [Maribacter sp. 4G9]PIB23591.1 hypothetical protein BFP75_10030 [Maribacter sp. 4G9]